MNRPIDRPLQFFFTTPLQPCPYLPDRLERKLVTELTWPDPRGSHDALTAAGFRRSYGVAYKPACPDCAACVPIRVRVAEHAPSRSQRRILRLNADLVASESAPTATQEQYALFRRYQEARHAGGGMAMMDFNDYRAMVETTCVDTCLVTFRDAGGRLVGASLTDRLRDGFSGVYKFFDPAAGARSLGTFMILWHIARAHALGLPFVYLGYWIEECGKMTYKVRFPPAEVLTPAGWRPRPA